MTHFQIWKELESKYRNIGTFIKILLAPQIFICCRPDLYHLKALFISFQMISTISLAIQGAECEIDFKMKFWAEKKCGYFPIKMGHFLKLHTRAYYPRGHMWVKFQRNRPRSQHPTTTHPTPPTRTGPQNFTKYFRPHRFRCYATMLYNIRLIDDVWSISMQDGVFEEYQLWQNEECHPHTPTSPATDSSEPPYHYTIACTDIRVNHWRVREDMLTSYSDPTTLYGTPQQRYTPSEIIKDVKWNTTVITTRHLAWGVLRHTKNLLRHRSE